MRLGQALWRRERTLRVLPGAPESTYSKDVLAPCPLPTSLSTFQRKMCYRLFHEKGSEKLNHTGLLIITCFEYMYVRHLIEGTKCEVP